MHMNKRNKTKFERNSSLKYYHLTYIVKKKTNKLKKSIVLSFSLVSFVSFHQKVIFEQGLRVH